MNSLQGISWPRVDRTPLELRLKSKSSSTMRHSMSRDSLSRVINGFFEKGSLKVHIISVCFFRKELFGCVEIRAMVRHSRSAFISWTGHHSF